MHYAISPNGIITSGHSLDISSRSGSSHGGGKRSAIRGFSAASARRLREVLCRYRGRGLPWAFTFTIPFDVSPNEYRRLFKRFCDRLAYLKVSLIWRVELTKRKRPHIHGVIYASDVATCFAVQRSWWDVIEAYPNDNAIFYSCVFQNISGCRWWRYVASHATKQKEEQLGWQGRQWGIVYRQGLKDCSVVSGASSDKQFYRVLRVLRRLSRCNYSRGYIGDAVWFCSPDTIKVLLPWASLD